MPMTVRMIMTFTANFYAMQPNQPRVSEQRTLMEFNPGILRKPLSKQVLIRFLRTLGKAMRAEETPVRGNRNSPRKQVQAQAQVGDEEGDEEGDEDGEGDEEYI